MGAEPGSGGRAARGESTRTELGRRGQAAARRVAESKATIPHLYLGRSLLLEAAPDPLVATVLQACALELEQRRRLNSSYRDGAIEEHQRVNIGVTVEGAEGALVPVLRDADRRNVEEIESELERLRQLAGEGALSSPDLAGGTFTVSALSRDADYLLPAVTPGQVAHLGVGRLRGAAMARAGSVRAGHALDLGLACDHRAVRPPEAADFLGAVAERLEGSGPTRR